MNDKKRIEQIIDIIEQNKKVNIEEIEITEKDGSKIKVKLQATQKTVEVMQQAAPAAIIPAAKAELPAGHIIKSPMVGTAYLTPSPEDEPFIKVGQTIKSGQTICLIEAMKMFNKIQADKSGVVKEILISSGQAIEFNQTLIIIGDA